MAGEIESDSYNRIMARASKFGARLFRNNTGLGWVGKIAVKTGSYIRLNNPRPLHAGLCKGSSDLIGFTPVVVTPEMVGKTIAIFTAVEVKLHKNSKVEKEQEQFIAGVERFGGFAFLALTDPEETAGKLAAKVEELSR